MFAIYLLALFAGLRRDEIDTLTWGQINFAERRVYVETNEHTAANRVSAYERPSC
jgi:thiamine transporter ThiT